MTATLTTSSRYRWLICFLLFLITINNYMDRQIISVAAPVIAAEFKLSNTDIAHIVTSFLFAYAFGLLLSGRFMDWIGSRQGFSLSVLVWSLASILTSLAGSVFSFSFYRFLLGVAESANFPGGVKVVAEWFPPKDRSTAVGIFTSGASIGAIVTPPLAAYLIVHYGWQFAFVAVSLPGFLWILAWRKLYRPADMHQNLEEKALPQFPRLEKTPAPSMPLKGVPWLFLLRQRLVWGVFLARFFEEPAAWFYFSWLPIYLKSVRDVPLISIGVLLIIPFVTLDIGYILGGWAASLLMKKGNWSLNRARKTIMVLSALSMVSSIWAITAATPLGFVLLISIATFGHGCFASNVITLPGDILPHQGVGTLYGLTAFGGSLGSIVFMEITGKLADAQNSFDTVFTIAGILPLVGAFIIITVMGKIGPLAIPPHTGTVAKIGC